MPTSVTPTFSHNCFCCFGKVKNCKKHKTKKIDINCFVVTKQERKKKGNKIQNRGFKKIYHLVTNLSFCFGKWCEKNAAHKHHIHILPALLMHTQSHKHPKAWQHMTKMFSATANTLVNCWHNPHHNWAPSAPGTVRQALSGTPPEPGRSTQRSMSSVIPRGSPGRLAAGCWWSGKQLRQKPGPSAVAGPCLGPCQADCAVVSVTVGTAGQPGTPFSFLKDIVSNVKSAVQENTPMLIQWLSFFHGALHFASTETIRFTRDSGGWGGGGRKGIGNESPGPPPCSHGSWALKMPNRIMSNYRLAQETSRFSECVVTADLWRRITWRECPFRKITVLNALSDLHCPLFKTLFIQLWKWTFHVRPLLSKLALFGYSGWYFSVVERKGAIFIYF